MVLGLASRHGGRRISGPWRPICRFPCGLPPQEGCGTAAAATMACQLPGGAAGGWCRRAARHYPQRTCSF